MKILISNDDGIGRPGILALEEAAKRITQDVYVVAPSNNKSGASHAMTLMAPLRIVKYDDLHYAVTGTPTDCIIMAMRYILDDVPDLVLSGVNYDSNLAEDIMYSGTVAAAMEGCVFGINSIALSQALDKQGTANWDVTKEVAYDTLKTVLDRYEFKKNIFLNINFPFVTKKEDIKGINITSHGMRDRVEDCIIRSIDPRGLEYFWMGSADYRKNNTCMDTTVDLGAINNGYISITPIALGMTALSEIKNLQEIL